MKIEIQCKQCTKLFITESQYIKRGHGKFCSLRCSALYNNEHRPLLTKICLGCKKPYQTKSKMAKYCSVRCNQLNRTKSTNKYRYHLNEIINKVTPTNICSNCGWNKTTCDVHHINPRCKNGSNDFSNLVIICPNCHRLMDRKLLDISIVPTVQKLVEMPGYCPPGP